MLGDTAVAMNPADPRAKYLVGKKVRLPIVGRMIPIIADEHVVLPEPRQRGREGPLLDRLPEGHARPRPGRLGDRPAAQPARHQRDGPRRLDQRQARLDGRHRRPRPSNLLGMDRFEAREAIVEWFRQENLLEDVRDYAHEVGHSYRSHVPIEPYLSDQWYIAVKKPIDASGRRSSAQGMIEGHRCAGELAGRPGAEAPARRPAAVHPRPLRQDLSDLAGEPPRLADQPPALVGTSDSGVVAESQCRRAISRPAIERARRRMRSRS